MNNDTKEISAKELAEHLDENVEAMYACEQAHINQAATMLRQQQAEIEVLKKQNADINRRLLGWDIYEQ